jgi:hypothetical protein
MLRLQLRTLFDRLIGATPSFLVKGLLKSFEYHPEVCLRAGYRVYPQVFYSPLIDRAAIDLGKLTSRRDLNGIRLDLASIKHLLRELEPYAQELGCLPRVPGTQNVIWHETYPTIDSAMLYCMVRHLKPRRYIEVGCGFSSKISSMALRKNQAEGHDCQSTFIEPYPSYRLDGADLFGDLLVERIEKVPLSYFSSLGENDVLFIDTSHVIKCQNDVEYELLHILPSLGKGVHVHIHDIFTPYDQPAEYIMGPRLNWGAANEQYAFECLISCTDRFAVTLPLHLLQRERPELLERIIPKATDRAQAFWIRVT